MKYSANVKIIVELVGSNPGIRRSTVTKLYNPQTVKRLEEVDVLQSFGSPRKLKLGTAMPPLTPKDRAKKGRYAPTQRAICSFVGMKGEATLGEICRELGRAPNDLSGTVLRMAAVGTLVRRMRQGNISGRTQSCVWYVYRLP